MIKIMSYIEFLKHQSQEVKTCYFKNSKCIPHETSRICLDCYEEYIDRNLPKSNTQTWVNPKWRGKTCLDDY